MKKFEETRVYSLPYPITLSLTEQTASTNDDLKAAAREGAPDFTVRIADKQLAGKGRNNRSFFSENGLYMSVLLPAKEEVLPFITAIAAVAVARAIRSLTETDAEIKWVNDVYVHGKKVCGILSESVVTGGVRRVIVGIGVNLNTPEEGFPEEIRAIAGSIDADRSELAAEILSRLLSLFEKGDIEGVCNEYRELCFLVGKRISVHKENGCVDATVTGLTKELALSVLYDDGKTEDLIAGDVSVRLF